MFTASFESIRNLIKMPKTSTILFRKLIVAIPVGLLLLVSIIQSVQVVNAQNSTMSGAGGSSGKSTITTTGNKTVITTSPAVPAPATSPPNYNRTGFTNCAASTHG